MSDDPRKTAPSVISHIEALLTELREETIQKVRLQILFFCGKL
jgi:hypothetical protein